MRAFSYIAMSFFLLTCFGVASSFYAHEPHKILIIMNKLPIGGAERALVNMLNYKTFPREEVELCLLKKEGAFVQVLHKGISVISLKEAEKRRYAVVISYLEGIDPKIWMQKIKTRKRIQWIHTDFATSLGLGKPPLYAAKNCVGIDSFVCVSEATRRSFCKVHPELSKKTEVIFNIVNEEFIRKEAEQKVQKFSKEKGVITIVTVSRLSRGKGIERALSVCKRLREEGFLLRWYIIGEGIERARIEKKIMKYKLEKSFILLGARTNPYPYLKQADIFALPSFLEGRSVVISEAQILGLPILATDVGGIREQISPGVNGMIVANSEHAIYEGLKFLLQHPEVRYKYRQALQGFRYNNDKSLMQIVKLFDNL